MHASLHLRSPCLRTAAACAVVLWAAGCPKRPPRFGPSGEITDPEVLLRRLDQRETEASSLKGEARAKVRSPRQSGSASQFVAVERPAKLHLEILDFFGRPAAALASDGSRFALFDAQTGTFYRGPATATNLALLLPVPLEPREAVTLLLGGLPRIEATERRLEIDEQAGAYRLTLRRGAATQTLWIATEDERPLRSELRGQAGYDVTFGDYEAYGSVIFPMSITVKAVDASGAEIGTSIEIRYKNLDLGLRLPPSLFDLEQPAGSREIELDALGRTRQGELPPPVEAPLQPSAPDGGQTKP